MNQEIDDIDKTYSETRRALLDLDVSKAIEASKQLIDTYKLIQLREFMYHKGTDREILFCDVLVAVIYLKIYNSSYRLLPEYTHIEREVWIDILKKGTLIKELWQSQQKLGENGIFAGKSATIQMPTSSGKTKSVALIILSSFLSKRANNAVVVAPFRSLCREISEELQKAFSFSDKIHVNEVSDVMQMDSLDVLLNEGETEEKQVFVVTPEKLLFILRQDILFIANIGLIIFDEGHLFDDMSRGITYELLISTIKFYMKDKMQKILISAVIPNAEQVNEWITNGSGVVIKNNIIQTTEKVVGIADIRISRKEKKKYAYLFFVNPQNPDEEEFFVPRVIGQVPLELKKRESKERLFPEINNDKYKNDIAIALSVNLCVNGGTAIFCGKKETANKILNRIIEIITKLLKRLSKRMRYGLVTQTSIILYEMGFNNRIVATKVADILDEKYVAGSRKEIVNLIKRDSNIRRKIEGVLQNYPTYFSFKFEEIVYE